MYIYIYIYIFTYIYAYTFTHIAAICMDIMPQPVQRLSLVPFNALSSLLVKRLWRLHIHQLPSGMAQRGSLPEDLVQQFKSHAFIPCKHYVRNISCS